MILAIILLSTLSWMEFPAPATSGQSTSQPAVTNSGANTAGTQGASQENSPSSTAPNAAQPTPAHAKTATHPRKKKVVAANCNATTTAASGSASKDAPGSSGTSAAGPTNATARTASTNCPPKKIIVRQGGTSEPSIQLEPSATGNQASQQKDSTNQILGTTEQNLKKLEGRRLSTDQENMVSQARQFMDQAKSAMNSGDLDRARTLAWKAQLLSEDLVKPEQ